MIRKTRWALALMISLALSACSGLDTREKQLPAGCAIASAAVQTLALANEAGKLTSQQQTNIIMAIGYIDPICGADAPPTMDSLKYEALTRAIIMLQAEVAKL